MQILYCYFCFKMCFNEVEGTSSHQALSKNCLIRDKKSREGMRELSSTSQNSKVFINSLKARLC